jgi:hypothetical protein
VAADDGELLAVIRVVKITDKFCLEVSELLSGGTVKMLKPETVGLAVANGVNNADAVALEHDRPIARSHRVLGAGSLQIQESGGAGWNLETTTPAFPWCHQRDSV